MTDQERDEVLLALLRRGLQAADPVPTEVTTAAKASFTWRTIDAELMELSFDSAVDDLVGVRGGSPTARSLRFEVASLEVEVDIDGSDLVGLVVGDHAGFVTLERSEGKTVVCDVDEFGRFEFQSAGGVPIRLRFGAHVTEWFLI